MENFSPGDRVVAINTDVSVPIYSKVPIVLAISLPDGLPRKNTIYHVKSTELSKSGSLGLFITGLRVFYGKSEITWHSSRFRKVDLTRDYVQKKKKRKQPMALTPN